MVEYKEQNPTRQDTLSARENQCRLHLSYIPYTHDFRRCMSAFSGDLLLHAMKPIYAIGLCCRVCDGVYNSEKKAKKEKKESTKKDGSAKKRPLSGYVFFGKCNRQEVLDTHEGIKVIRMCAYVHTYYSTRTRN